MLIFHAIGDQASRRCRLDRWIGHYRWHSQSQSSGPIITTADTIVHIRYIENY
jgi:hypothetical protein